MVDKTPAHADAHSKKITANLAVSFLVLFTVASMLLIGPEVKDAATQNSKIGDIFGDSMGLRNFFALIVLIVVLLLVVVAPAVSGFRLLRTKDPEQQASKIKRWSTILFMLNLAASIIAATVYMCAAEPQKNVQLKLSVFLMFAVFTCFYGTILSAVAAF